MSFISRIFGAGASKIIDSVGSIIDNLSLSKEEKAEFKLQMQSKMLQYQQELEETYRTELTSRAEIIKAELTQGDAYTKRARPTIIYVGLLFILIVYVLVPIFSEGKLKVELPEEFWWAWGTVVGVYGAGRSAEKLGITNRATHLMTGSNAYKAEEAAKG